MGIHGWGDDITAAFEETAAAMFELIADIDGLDAKQEIPIFCEGNDPEELLVEFLNSLIARADIAELVLAKITIDGIVKADNHWTLNARAFGAPRDDAKERFLTEVKAATYYGADVKAGEGGRWEARCVVDL
jgi:SHS2 domain-containing protein